MRAPAQTTFTPVELFIITDQPEARTPLQEYLECFLKSTLAFSRDPSQLTRRANKS